MTLSTLAILVGLVYSMPSFFVLAKPDSCREFARKFPRSEPCGWVLMLLATAWMLYYLRLESNSDIAKMKPFLTVLFVALGLGACVFLRDFLAVRGLAVVLLLAAKLVLDTQRWHDSPWRLVLAVMAYAWIFAGMWLTISPWRLRDMIEWVTETDERLRCVAGARVAGGLLLMILGFTQF
jgi:hypothetical protein